MRFKDIFFLFCFPCILASCSSSTEGSEKTNANIENMPYLPEIHTVEIVQMQFQPAVLNVHRGDTVVFVNNDIVTHDATAMAGKAWSSGELPVGMSWKFVPTENVIYFCSIHEVMRGEIIVE